MAGNWSYWCLVLPLLFQCAKLEEHANKQAAKGDYPVLEMQDSIIIDMYDESQLAWIMKTRYMKKLAQSEVLFARPVDMVIYDSSGGESAWVKADSGSADESVTFVSVWGNVLARSLNGATVQADSLVWRKRNKQIKTDGWVKVISEMGDTLTGIGFVSDDRLENWKILSSVRGVIQRVEERIDEMEDAPDDTL